MAKSKNTIKPFECLVSVDGSPMVCYGPTLKSKTSDSQQGFGDDEGLTGTQFPTKTRRRHGRDDVSGMLPFKPTPAEASTLLQTFFTGTSGSGAGDWLGYTKYPLTEAMHIDFDDADPAGSYTVLKDMSAQGYTYNKCVTEQLTLRWEENGSLELELEVLGCQETAGAVTIGSADADTPLMAYDLTTTLGGSEYFAKGGEIVLARNFTSRFHNSKYRSSVSPGKFTGTIRLDLDWNSDSVTDLYAKCGTNTALAFALVIDTGTDALGLDIPEAVVTSDLPDLPGEGDWTPALELAASYDGTNDIVTAYANLA